MQIGDRGAAILAALVDANGPVVRPGEPMDAAWLGLTDLTVWIHVQPPEGSHVSTTSGHPTLARVGCALCG